MYCFRLSPGETKAVPAGMLLQTDENFEFKYGNKYLERQNAIPVDMFNLPLQAKKFILDEGNLGAIRDSAPDFWGRLVFDKLSSIQYPGEIDYLLATNTVRISNLDFRKFSTDPEPAFDVPEYANLPEIIKVAEMIDTGETLNEKQKKVAILLRIGSSLGGARPKCVVNLDGELWLAKFPAKDDKYNNAKIEAATMTLASYAGVKIPKIKVENIAGKDVFFIKRFDRIGLNIRTPYVSALTMLKISEYDHAKFSYLNLTEKIRQYGNRSDLKQLFRRIAINIIVRNTDDHPRNHGFLLKNGEWRLTPAFDITPTALTKGISNIPRLAMTLGDMGKEGNLENLLSHSNEFNLTPKEGKEIFNQCVATINNSWRKVFHDFSVSSDDTTKFYDTFTNFKLNGDDNGEKEQSHSGPALSSTSP